MTASPLTHESTHTHLSPVPLSSIRVFLCHPELPGTLLTDSPAQPEPADRAHDQVIDMAPGRVTVPVTEQRDCPVSVKAGDFFWDPERTEPALLGVNVTGACVCA